MFAAENRAGVRHLKRQIQALRKGDGPAAAYMQQVKTLADAMAAAGSPLSDDDIIDYMLTGLGSAFNPIAASMNFAGGPISLATFYASVLSYEALQKTQVDSEDWSSLANSAARPVNTNNSAHAYDSNRPAGGAPQGQGQPNYGQGAGGQDRCRNDGTGGKNNRNGNSKGGGNSRTHRNANRLQSEWEWEQTIRKKSFRSLVGGGVISRDLLFILASLFFLLTFRYLITKINGRRDEGAGRGGLGDPVGTILALGGLGRIGIGRRVATQAVKSIQVQLAPIVGQEAALAGVHIRAGLHTIAGERVFTALVDHVLGMDFINDNTSCFANGGKFPKNGSVIEFGSFRVYYGTVPVRQYLSPVLVAPDPPRSAARNSHANGSIEVLVVGVADAGKEVAAEGAGQTKSTRAAKPPLERDEGAAGTSLRHRRLLSSGDERARRPPREHRPAAQAEAEAAAEALSEADIIRARRELNLTLREYNAAHGFAS
ncbi:hypothetical protein QYE76_054369 [Lolium multiflorum]|uniref:Uncharacterized protein n=1 Tax=Lolium multiflorum TaxID=4521 RepID=A0AAD8SYZ3_LOLMU|nr:hypothetical protein QYE76_054369 [Lolium multiflorum]